PHVAEQVFEALVAEHKLAVRRDEWLDREHGVEKQGARLVAIRTLGGTTYRGRVFIDATYEGDLLAAAGVSYTVGREPNSKYGETLNGVARKWNNHLHRFTAKVDPYVKPGDPTSGLLFGIDPNPLPPDGEGDK